MALPNVWGGGASFAFSALDGNNIYNEAISANLLSDKLGLGFNTALKAYLYIALENVSDVIFEVVSSDLIKASIVANDGSISAAEFIFVRQNTVLVRHLKAYRLKCVFDGEVEYIRKGNTEIYTGENGIFALYSEENEEYRISAFACGNDAAKYAEDAFTTEINREISGKLDFFAKLPIVENMPKNLSSLFGKCMSVLKSLAYSADGNFNGMWCTPSRLGGEKMSPFCAAMCAYSMRYISPVLAKQCLMSALNLQDENGFIPSAATPDFKGENIEPPMLAHQTLQLFKSQGDISILSESFEKLKKYLNYIIETRAGEDKMLFEWKIKISETENRCEESRMDSSPRFDGISKIYAIDFSCYMASEARALSKIAEILGKTGEHLYWSVIYDRIKEATNRYLYDEEDGLYYDKCAATGKLIKVKTAASLLPLFAGFCDKKRADSIITKYLFNTDEFFTPFPVPSLAKNEEKFDGSIHRGASHPYFAYFTALALLDYGYKKEAQRVMADVVSNIARQYENTGVLYEFYDSRSAVAPAKIKCAGEAPFAYIPEMKRVNIRDYGITAAVFAEIIMTLFRRGTPGV